MLHSGQVINTLSENIKLIAKHNDKYWMGQYCTKNGTVKSNANTYLFETSFLESHVGQSVDFSKTRKSEIMSAVNKYMKSLNSELDVEVRHSFTNKRKSSAYIGGHRLEFGMRQLCELYTKGYVDYEEFYIDNKTIDIYLWSDIDTKNNLTAIKMIVAHEFAHALEYKFNGRMYFTEREAHNKDWADLVKEIFKMLEAI